MVKPLKKGVFIAFLLQVRYREGLSFSFIVDTSYNFDISDNLKFFSRIQKLLFVSKCSSV